MKTKIIPIIVFISVFLIIFYSCEDATYKEYEGNAPVYMSYEDLRLSVSDKTDEEIKNPGKIYFKDNYIFIVEELKGIHVFDNTNPSSPTKKVFIKLPGVVDISISGSAMYADSYVDLVVLDVADVDNIHETGRSKNILPYTVPPVENDYPMGTVDKEKGVVIDWELKTIKERVNNSINSYPIYRDISFALASSSSASSGSERQRSWYWRFNGQIWNKGGCTLYSEYKYT